MGSKTIGIKDDVYERLKARKREDESFTDLMGRLLDESTVDWREGFGTLDADEAEELQRAAEASRTQMSNDLATRQQIVLEDLSDTGDTDETA
ncbi:MAG: antitoxin VapB family protein [Halobacteriales archaeon]